MFYKSILMFFIALLIGFFAFHPRIVQAAEPTTHDPLSQITADDVQNVLEANKGKVIVLNFFASWCPPCRVEIPDIVRVRKEYSEEKLFILGLSVDEQAQALEVFAKNMPFNYPVYRVDEDIVRLYRFSSIPYNVVLSPTGETLYAAPGLLSYNDLIQHIERGGLAE